MPIERVGILSNFETFGQDPFHPLASLPPGKQVTVSGGRSYTLTTGEGASCDLFMGICF